MFGKRSLPMLVALAMAGSYAGQLAKAASSATAPTAEELAAAKGWTAAHLTAATDNERPQVPFSFVYAGRPSADLLPTWEFRAEVRQLDAGRRQHTLQYRDPQSGLRVRCVTVEHQDFPTLHWTVYFQNPGPADTPLLEQIQALDVGWECPADGAAVLHHHLGTPCTPEDYRPLQTRLSPGTRKRLSAAGGRPTNSDLCYFNLAWEGQGVIVALGWPGQWAAEFARVEPQRFTVRAGQELFRARLRGGEEIRTPQIALQFWKGERIRAQNIWRRWMLAYNTPRPAGKPLPPHFASTSGNLTNAAREIGLLGEWARQRIPLDYWIMDAHWYPTAGRWFQTGTWEPDRRRFPDGLRAVHEVAHAQGAKSVVWFEPERVAPGTWLWEMRPQWLLGCPDELAQTPQLGRWPSRLLNLGDREARNWLIEHVDGLITREKIDVYRQDFNIDPLAYWRANDPPHRQGITEHDYVTGYLAWWDELLKRHPEIWIDTCASGGRRNDLETLRRSAPLLRSDFFTTAESQQCQTLGIAQWLPLYGSGTGPADEYLTRSSFCPFFRIGVGSPAADDMWRQIRRHAEQFRRIAPYLLGDFYPLTTYSLEKNLWCAWQFDRPEQGAGVVQVFRREQCGDGRKRFPLFGLEAAARYRVTNLDAEPPFELSGAELLGPGVEVMLRSKPAAAILVYEKIQ